MIRSKSLKCEVYSPEARFGLGAVASNGGVDFKEYSRDTFGSQIHGKGGAPYGRNTFRYADGFIIWSDGHPEKEIKDIIETYLHRKGFPVKKHKSYFDNYGPPDDNVDESSYHDKLSSDEKNDLAMSYFNIGHDNSEDAFGSVVDASNYCWIWSKGDGAIRAKKGGTHSTNFGTNAKEYTYSGWYDEAKDTISVVFPKDEYRKFGNRKPTVDDIPERIYQALIRTFGKRNPKIVVFENMKKLKPIIKEIVLALMYESMFPKEFDRHRLGSCMAAAELATKYLLNKGIKDFQIVEGWVAFSDDYDIERRGDKYYEGGDVYSHTWIEFKNGRTFDPTKKQWKEWGYDPKDAKIVKVKTKYTPEEYLEACEWEPSNWQKFKKQTNEIRLEPPVDVTVREDVKIKDEKQKQQIIKNLIPRLKDDNVVITVNRFDELPAASYVQVDFFIKGQNILSTNAENMIAHGFKMPTTKQILASLPTGRYKMSDLKGKLTENMTYDQLLKLTASTPRSPDDNTNRIDRAKNVRARSIPVSVEEGQEQWNFRYKSNPSVTNKPFEGQITFLKGDVERRDDAMELECKVDCGCPDYRYKFAYNNYKQGAGDIGPDTLNKCINQAPQKPYDIGEGLCKHLTALRGYLQTKISSTKKSNLFEAINEVAQQGPFNITYYD